MKNDLTKFEKDLLKSINFKWGKKFTYENLMEWSSSKDVVMANMKDGEELFNTLGIYIAIKA
jgi:hypothetical protein